MKLSVKITFLLFSVITLFIGILFAYFYQQINNNLDHQSRELAAQMTKGIGQTISLQREQLQKEMMQLAESLFVENESTLAALLSQPPDFQPGVIAFAEKLRKRTSLDFLYLISSDDIVVSNSSEPAAFGKRDPRPDYPFDAVAFVYDGGARMEEKIRVPFGKRHLDVRGGYRLQTRFESQPFSFADLKYREGFPVEDRDAAVAADKTVLQHNLTLQDYRGIPIVRLSITTSTKPLLDQRRNLIMNSAIFVAGTFLLCVVLGYFVSVSISRPLAELSDAAHRMAGGDLGARVSEGGSGEVAGLIQAFNRMAGQLEENQRKLLQAERVAAWQEIAKHLAHEIKNPLTPIKTSISNLQLCMEKAPEKFPEIFRESSASILEEVEKLRHLADEFARFARLPAPVFKSGNLNETIQQSLLLYREESTEHPQIQFRPGEIPPIEFDPGQMSQVVHNLIQNSVDATAAKGIIKVSTSTERFQDRSWICFVVEDNGTGINQSVRQKVFLPYFTTKAHGTGLGLAIVQRIITDHGGLILVDSDPGKGTRFEIRLPAS